MYEYGKSMAFVNLMRSPNRIAPARAAGPDRSGKSLGVRQMCKHRHDVTITGTRVSQLVHGIAKHVNAQAADRFSIEWHRGINLRQFQRIEWIGVVFELNADARRNSCELSADSAFLPRGVAVGNDVDQVLLDRDMQFGQSRRR
jgi:hypothetical protein